MFFSTLSPSSLPSDINPTDGNPHSLRSSRLHRIGRPPIPPRCYAPRGAPIPLRAASATTPSPRLLQNLIDTGVVDKLDVFGAAGDDNDNLLRALINADLPGGDLDLGVWNLLGVAVLSFAGVPALLGYLVQAAG